MILTELSQFAEDTISLTTAILILLLGLTIAILYIIQTIKDAQIKHDYIKNLDNEHDKAVIKDYENAKFTWRKRKK